MCGIAGAIIEHGDTIALKMFYHVLENSKQRGIDSSGLIIYNDNDMLTEIKSFKNDIDYEKEIVRNSGNKGYTYFIHTSRAEPTTEWKQKKKLKKDIPPFFNEKFIVAHNGIISNDIELKIKYDLKVKSDIDTAIIPPLIDEVGVSNTLTQIVGGCAFIIFDINTKTFFLARNFMPLVAVKIQNSYIFASEKRFFKDYDKLFKSYQMFELPSYSYFYIEDGKCSEIFEWYVKDNYYEKR